MAESVIHPLLLPLIACALYALATMLLWRALSQHRALRLPLCCSLAAVLVHMLALKFTMFTFMAEGVNVGLLNIATAVSVIINAWIVLAVVLGLRNVTGWAALLLITQPIAALTVITDAIVPNSRFIAYSAPTGLDLHIVLSIIAYSILSLTALLALVWWVTDVRLKQHRIGGWVNWLPPLAAAEAALFRLLAIGLAVLTLALIYGVSYVHNLFAQHLVHKTVLSLAAWGIFALVLWGRTFRGWRGRRAVQYFLLGFVFLMLAYYGSAAVLQLILHRA